MNTYERIKETVTVPQAAERYGLTAGRNGMVCCPFHHDRHPSLKLNRDYYYCFGCGIRGDVIDLTGKLLNLPPGRAAHRLCSDFGISPPIRASPEVRTQRVNDEERCRKALCAYRDVLRQWKRAYVPIAEAETPHPRYAEACNQLDRVEYEEERLYYAKGSDKAVLVSDMIGSGRIERIEHRLRQIREGENEDGTE